MNLEKFEDPVLAKKLIEKIKKLGEQIGDVKIMEVCGTHTMEIGRLGLRSLLPSNIQLISGPGCPVCVTPGAYIDAAVELALRQGVHLVSYGDMIRVPGLKHSFEKARSAGTPVTVAASPLEAVKLAQQNPSVQYVSVAVGFETTAPSTARALEEASSANLDNVSFLVCHRLVPPALAALGGDPELKVNGFLLPGHVSAIIGKTAYALLDEMKVPGVITGFTSVDILLGILDVLDMLVTGKHEVRNAYSRVVREDGNTAAKTLIEKIFKPCDAEFRGIGVIPMAGLKIRKEYDAYNAEKKYNLTLPADAMPKGCSCGEVLKGKMRPDECPLFDKACTPETPVGPCMVSTEGSCAAYYKYERRSQ